MEIYMQVTANNASWEVLDRTIRFRNLTGLRGTLSVKSSKRVDKITPDFFYCQIKF